jgi:hypothetical protein
LISACGLTPDPQNFWPRPTQSPHTATKPFEVDVALPAGVNSDYSSEQFSALDALYALVDGPPCFDQDVVSRVVIFSSLLFSVRGLPQFAPQHAQEAQCESFVHWQNCRR